MSSEKYDNGLAVRRKVLGSEHVDRGLQNATEFNQPVQELVTENAWGSVWVREGLSLQERSMITLAMLAALNRPRELRMHLRGAVNNGLTREQIREVLLHTHAYCGWPACIDAFHVASEFFAEEDGQA